MHKDCFLIEQRRKPALSITEMIYPDRGIDEDQAFFGRRRGGAFIPGALPPRSASRRAASR